MSTELKIIEAEVKNFQSLEMKKVELLGKSVAVIGKNEGSKSALIRAIQSALDSKFFPAKALKEGTEEGSIKVVVSGTHDGEEKTYTYEVFYDENRKKGKYKVVDEEGMEIKGRTIQQSIIGNIAFDPFEFINLSKTDSGTTSKSGTRKQVDFLKQFLTVDEIKSLNKIDREYKEVYDERTLVNKMHKEAEMEMNSIDIDKERAEKYKEDKSDELSKKREELEGVFKAEAEYDKAVEAKDYHKDKIQSIEKQIKQLQIDLKEHQGRHDHAVEWLAKHEKPSAEKLKDEISALEEHQKNHQAIAEVRKTYAKVKDYKKKSEEMSKRLKALDKEKKETFANANLPVKGLEFTEDSISYKGKPFDEDHHPKSTIIKVGVAIAMKLAANLRCIFIKDGSLLDKETYKGILKMCNDKGYQLIIEMVDWNADDMRIEFSEELIK